MPCRLCFQKMPRSRAEPHRTRPPESHISKLHGRPSTRHPRCVPPICRRWKTTAAHDLTSAGSPKKLGESAHGSHNTAVVQTNNNAVRLSCVCDQKREIPTSGVQEARLQSLLCREGLDLFSLGHRGENQTDSKDRSSQMSTDVSTQQAPVGGRHRRTALAQKRFRQLGRPGGSGESQHQAENKPTHWC